MQNPGEVGEVLGGRRSGSLIRAAQYIISEASPAARAVPAEDPSWNFGRLDSRGLKSSATWVPGKKY